MPGGGIQELSADTQGLARGRDTPGQAVAGAEPEPDLTGIGAPVSQGKGGLGGHDPQGAEAGQGANHLFREPQGQMTQTGSQGGALGGSARAVGEGQHSHQRRCPRCQLDHGPGTYRAAKGLGRGQGRHP